MSVFSKSPVRVRILIEEGKIIEIKDITIIAM